MVDRYSRCSNYRGSVNANGINPRRMERAQRMCGCGNSREENECKKLFYRLQKVEFAIIDTVLYLDAYPCSATALDYYHKLLDERDAIVDTLSCKCNMPLTSFENRSDDAWVWSEGPWPWEPDAN